ncbi:MAG: hypothetical protein QOK15_1476 [Nocardioidaceae bacterium]|nr:hypothetical protein [Nocardioidaceae bacterium]
MARTPVLLEVRTLLQDLLARSVDVTATSPWSPEPAEPATFAVYVDDSLRIRSAVVADLPFSAYAATAIALLPGEHARCAIAERTLSRELRENLTEVLDICASPQNGECVPRTTLYQVHHAGDPVSRRVAVLGAVVGRRLDVAVRIAGYGTGRLSFVAVDRLPR